jgi:hypothetical protein
LPLPAKLRALGEVEELMSTNLHEKLAAKVATWREQRFALEEHPAIGEILEWAANPDGSGFRLRTPQLRGLETYWYLRLVETTPHVFELYTRLFGDAILCISLGETYAGYAYKLVAGIFTKKTCR